MPLSPQKQAARRARLSERPDSSKLPKKRCLNCPKFFPLTKAWRKFCSTACKNEFERNGGTAYAQLRPKLEKLVRSLVKVLEDRVNKIEFAALPALEGRIHGMNFKLGDLSRIVLVPESKTLPPPSQPTK